VRPRGKDSIAVISLKERMTSSAEPVDRAISTCPEGSWLDGLRTSFEPETRKQRKPELSSEQELDSKPKLFAGRLRSA
jgi:hypothetical protein